MFNDTGVAGPQSSHKRRRGSGGANSAYSSSEVPNCRGGGSAEVRKPNRANQSGQRQNRTARDSAPTRKSPETRNALPHHGMLRLGRVGTCAASLHFSRVAAHKGEPCYHADRIRFNASSHSGLDAGVDLKFCPDTRKPAACRGTGGMNRALRPNRFQNINLRTCSGFMRIRFNLGE